MTTEFDPASVSPDHVFDGGDLDCGSGLVLLIREAMLRVPVGGILEMRSREPTVADDLPPWCRMVGHLYLGHAPGEGETRYFVRRGQPAAADASSLQADKDRARDYEWRARVRRSAPLAETVYCRNFSFTAGQPASFEEKDAHPSAIEYLIGALGADLVAVFADQCGRAGLAVDDIELTVRARLHNVFVSLGAEDGDPSLRSLEVKCFASTMEDERAVRAAWEQAAARSPILATLAKAASVETRLSII
jgi:TusA-related sulfurtransferase